MGGGAGNLMKKIQGLITAFIDAIARDKPGAIMIVLFIMILQTEIYWQQMICVGLMFLAFLIRNQGKIKNDNDNIPDP